MLFLSYELFWRGFYALTTPVLCSAQFGWQGDTYSFVSVRMTVSNGLFKVFLSAVVFL